MLAAALSFAVHGVDAIPVEVEAYVSRDVRPAFTIVGLPDTSVREARDRVRSGAGDGAVRACRTASSSTSRRRPCARSAPASTSRSRSPSWRADGAVPRDRPAGRRRARRARSRRHRPARARGARRGRAGAPDRPRRAAVRARVVRGGGARRRRRTDPVPRASSTPSPSCVTARCVPCRRRCGSSRRATCPTCADVRGQPLARRALEIAAAGAHNLLFVGPPGVGKSMLARRLPGILPPLTPAESLEVTRLQSVAGTFRAGGGLVTRAAVPRAAPLGHRAGAGRRRSRAPSGRAQPREPRRAVPRRAARSSGATRWRRCAARSRTAVLVIARARGSVAYPCRAAVVAAMNPCPCGGAAGCTCTAERKHAYRRRVSGPLLDRMDLGVRLQRPSAEVLRCDRPEASIAVAERVREALARQAARGGPAERAARRRPSVRRALRARRRGGGDAAPRHRPDGACRRAASTAACASRARSPTWRAPRRSRPSTSPRRSRCGSGASRDRPTGRARLARGARRASRPARRAAPAPAGRRTIDCASCCARPSWRSSAPGRRRRPAPRSRSGWRRVWRGPGSRWCPASPAASTAPRTPGALEAGGRTVAVLGCGVDVDYPRSNAALAARVAAAGADRSPSTRRARRRRRGASRPATGSWRRSASAIVVVEAARTSGALITAGFALELGREVLAVPASPWVDAAAGGNALLRDGAGVVTGAGRRAGRARDRSGGRARPTTARPASAPPPRGCWPRSAARPARRRPSAPGSRSVRRRCRR